MDSDTDSDASHISATPPRRPPGPKVPMLPTVRRGNPWNDARPVAAETELKSSRLSRLSSFRHGLPASSHSVESSAGCVSSEKLTRLRLCPSADLSGDSNARFRKQQRLSGSVDADQMPLIVCRNSADFLGGLSENVRAASHVSGRSSISGLAKRRNLSLAPTDVSEVSEPCPRTEYDGDSVESGSGDIEAEKPATPGEHDRAGGAVKAARSNPNLFAAIAPLPISRPKRANEGNFVKLNFKRYGRKKFGKKGGKSSSSRSFGKFKRGKAKKPCSDSASKAGHSEEDGVVLEEFHSHQGVSELRDQSFEQALVLAREDPSAENLLTLLKLSHGYDCFRDGQLKAIQQVIEGKSTMLVLPTGAGKSLCYQLPALILPGITLVISPLVALMVDQLQRLPPMLPGGLLSSNQTYEEVSETLNLLTEGKLKVLFVSPERLMNEDFLSKCEMLPLISLVAVDEAHCLSEWSHNFRPSYLRIRASLLQTRLKAGCILAMTATATTKTLHSIMCALGIPVTNFIKSSHIRENLKLSVTLSGNRMKDLIALMTTAPIVEVKSIIIYCKFQSESDAVSKYLRDNNISAKSYHSGIPARDRSRVQKLFCSNKLRVVVSTVAFGMGLDKSDVGAVIHYSLPESLEEYVQETGRAGRDGRISYCHLLLEETTFYKLRSLSYSEGVDQYSVNKLLSQIFNNDLSSPRKVCSMIKESASRKFDMKEEVILTVLTYLEIGKIQYLQLLPQLNATCTLQFYKSSITVLSNKDAVVATILKKSDIKQGNYVFDITTIANTVGTPVTGILNQLQKLKLMGEITYELKDPAYCYTIVRVPDDFCSLISQITGWLSDVEKCKVQKLDAMYDAALFAAKECLSVDECCESAHTSCLQRKISDYFIRDSDDISGNSVIELESKSPFLHADIKVFLRSNSNIKFSPRAVARIMHGIPSPSFSPMTWSKCPYWGRYSQLDFLLVMEAATKELKNLIGKVGLEE